MGSECAGDIEQVGEGVENFKVSISKYLITTHTHACAIIMLLYAELFSFLSLFQVGDRVVALPDHKAWAELVAVPATSVFALPPGMSYLDAAATTMNYTVAYILLFELANLTPGKSLLLHSAGGGVVSISHYHRNQLCLNIFCQVSENTN